MPQQEENPNKINHTQHREDRRDFPSPQGRMRREGGKQGTHQAAAEHEHWVIRGSAEYPEISRTKTCHAKGEANGTVSMIGTQNIFPDHHQDPHKLENTTPLTNKGVMVRKTKRHEDCMMQHGNTILTEEQRLDSLAKGNWVASVTSSLFLWESWSRILMELPPKSSFV